MIRVNLAKTNSHASVGTQTAIKVDGLSLSGNGEIIQKVLVMSIFLILVIVYEKYTINQKTEKLIATQQQLDQIQMEVEKFASVKAVVEGLVKERNNLNEQLKVIEKISQKRAYKLKTITLVQESLPDDLWLNEMEIEKNIINFKGYSKKPTSVQMIARKLSNAEFIASALAKEIKRVTVEKRTLQEFNIEAKVLE